MGHNLVSEPVCLPQGLNLTTEPCELWAMLKKNDLGKGYTGLEYRELLEVWRGWVFTSPLREPSSSQSCGRSILSAPHPLTHTTLLLNSGQKWFWVLFSSLHFELLYNLKDREKGYIYKELRGRRLRRYHSDQRRKNKKKTHYSFRGE